MKFVFNVSGWLQNFNIFFMYWRKFFCPYAGCQRLSYTSDFKKHLCAPIGLNEYFVKKAPIGVYKCFLKSLKNFRQYMKNMLKFCIHPETLKTNFIEYV